MVADSGRLTLRLRDMPLDELLGDISRRTGASIVVSHGRGMRVTGEVRGLALEGALRRLLGACGVAGVYPSADAPWPSAVWIDCRHAAPVAAATEDTDMFGDVPGKLAFIETLESDRDSLAAPLLGAIAQREPDEEVQVAAVRALGRLASAAALDPLGHALAAGSATVRAAALESFAELGLRQATPLVEAALQDPEPGLRDKAEEVLVLLSEPPGDDHPVPSPRRLRRMPRPF